MKKNVHVFGIWNLDYLVFYCNSLFSQAIIVDHTCTNIYNIPISAVETAKAQLHIGYGHTSHGNQLIAGMNGLVGFMNSKGGYTDNLFAWNHEGTDGALHLFEGDQYGSGDLDHDAGYDTAWVAETRAYLGVPDLLGRGSNHPEMNVIIWSWCGQLSGYPAEAVSGYYLDRMNQLELDYSGVKFVYMTGHSDGSGLDGTLHINNQQIRQYCIDNNKILYDFYDIECYDPDGNYFGDKHVNDACDYDGGGNWAAGVAGCAQRGGGLVRLQSRPYPAVERKFKGLCRLVVMGAAGRVGWAGFWRIAAGYRQGLQPDTPVLEQNYPNPFNSSTKFQYLNNQN